MLTIRRPGERPLEVESIFIDFEGTLASDRRVHPKAKDKMNLLSKRAKIYILTMGEREVIEPILKRVNAEVVYIDEREGSQQKRDFLKRHGEEKTVAIGNGADDASMMKEAGLSICVIGKEGVAGEALKTADVTVTNILDALDFLLKPLRQKATLGL